MDLTWDHHPTMCQNAAAFLMFHWSHLHGNVLVVLHFALTSPVNNSRLGPWGLSTLSVGNSRIDACYVCKIVMQHDARRQNIYMSAYPNSRILPPNKSKSEGFKVSDCDPDPHCNGQSPFETGNPLQYVYVYIYIYPLQ